MLSMIARLRGELCADKVLTLAMQYIILMFCNVISMLYSVLIIILSLLEYIVKLNILNIILYNTMPKNISFYFKYHVILHGM